MSKIITIALIGCSKTKQILHPGGYAAARDLYVSDLFRKRVEHVESRGLQWYVISAKSGLLKPTTLLRMYDKTMADLTEIERAEWHVGVANQLLTELFYEFGEPKLSAVAVELHAGAKYCEPLGAILELIGMKVIKPVAGMEIGQQLAYYKSAVPALG